MGCLLLNKVADPDDWLAGRLGSSLAVGWKAVSIWYTFDLMP